MRTGARIAGLGAALLVAAAAFAGCGSSVHHEHFIDDFDQGFPGNRWLTSGSAPVLDTTAGDAAPSLEWTACAGSGGAAAINRTFYGAASFTASFVFEVWGSSDTAGAGVAFQMFGNGGDILQATIVPDGGGQPGLMEFDIDGPAVAAAPPTDGGFHKVSFSLDAYGDAVWSFDGNLVAATGPIYSTVFTADFLCVDQSAPTGPMPILLDDVDVEGRPQ